MFGGLAAGFAHLVKPSNNAQGIASDKRTAASTRAVMKTHSI